MAIDVSLRFLIGMLIWRIWRVTRQINNNTDLPGGPRATPLRPMQRYMQAVAESGAVYTATVIATLVAGASRSSAIYIAVDIVSNKLVSKQ
jgi:hypothetical protein